MIELECRAIIVECLDNILHDHVVEMELKLNVEKLLNDFENVFLNDVALETIKDKIYREECCKIIHEVVLKETKQALMDSVNHCGAILTFSQYKQIIQVCIQYIKHNSTCLSAFNSL